MAQEHLWKSLLTDWDLHKFEDAFDENGFTDPIDWKDIDDGDLNTMGLKRGHKLRFYRHLKQWIQEEGKKNNIHIKQEPISDNSDIEIIGASHPSSQNNNAANLRNVNNSAVPLDNKNPLADLVVNINNNNNNNDWSNYSQCESPPPPAILQQNIQNNNNNNNNANNNNNNNNNNNQQIDIEAQNHLNQPQNNINDGNETTESENNESEHNNSNYISNMNRNDSDHPSYNEISPQTFTQDTDVSASVHMHSVASNNLLNQDMDIDMDIDMDHSDDDNIDNINVNNKMKKRKLRVVSDHSDVSQSSSISQYSSSVRSGRLHDPRSVSQKMSYCYGCLKKFDTQKRKDRHNCAQYPIDVDKYINNNYYTESADESDKKTKKSKKRTNKNKKSKTRTRKRTHNRRKHSKYIRIKKPKRALRKTFAIKGPRQNKLGLYRNNICGNKRKLNVIKNNIMDQPPRKQRRVINLVDNESENESKLTKTKKKPRGKRKSFFQTKKKMKSFLLLL